MVYTDGSCYNRDGSGGWGFVVLKNHKIVFRKNGQATDTTSNQMEMQAVLEALRYIHGHHKFVHRIIIRSDSSYVVNGMNDWIHKWALRGWCNSNGDPIKNIDIWKELRDIRTRCLTYVQWVKGHAGIYGNEEADRLAGLGRKGILVRSILKKKVI